MDQHIEVPIDEERDNNETANDLPPAEPLSGKRGFSRSKKVADLLMNKSEERNLLIKQIMDQNKQILEKKEQSFDELDLFFKTMAVTAKKLPTKGRLEAKTKIFSLMTKLEEKYLLDEQPEQLEQPIFVHQPMYPHQTMYQHTASRMLNVHTPPLHVPLQQNHFQTSQDSIQPSPTTSASIYSRSSDSQFSLYNLDEAST